MYLESNAPYLSFTHIVYIKCNAAKKINKYKTKLPGLIKGCNKM